VEDLNLQSNQLGPGLTPEEYKVGLALTFYIETQNSENQAKSL
jgi:hypothetical protein